MSENVDFGIRKRFACGVRNPGLWNPYNDWNPESKFYWQEIRNPVPRIPKLESKIVVGSTSAVRWGWMERRLIFRIAACNQCLGCFPLFRTDRPDHSRRNDNFSFNLNSPARSVKSWIVCIKGDNDFSAKTLGKSLFHYQWSGRPVLTNGKHPKIIAGFDSLT